MAFAAAHRGLSAEYPENTLAALRAAVAAGFRCLEIDLRCTSDGEIVLLHDAGIDRTTDGNGRVADMKYDELRGYETGEGPVPRLDDVLTALATYDGFWNIEVKDHGATLAVLGLCVHHGIASRMQLSSVDPRALAVALTEYPEIVRGLIVLGPPDEEDLAVGRELACSWINVDGDYMDAQRMASLSDAGFLIGVWTVNDVEQGAELVEAGAGCIISDVADLLIVAPDPPRFA
jgi:glycerophosphoryl diester phosphodiesterase